MFHWWPQLTAHRPSEPISCLVEPTVPTTPPVHILQHPLQMHNTFTGQGSVPQTQESPMHVRNAESIQVVCQILTTIAYGKCSKIFVG